MAFAGTVARSGSDDGPRAFRDVTIVGAGAWGTALALTADRAGCAVSLWAREVAVETAVAADRINPFLPNVEIPPTIRVISDLADALRNCELAVLVCPSQHLRSIARQVEPLVAEDVPVVICSKGVEGDSGLLMSQVVAQVMPGRPQAVLSGPTFAAEVARDLPTAATVAAELNPSDSRDWLAARVAATFATPNFRPYLSDDVIGVEIGGAAKNVLAIACGVAEGRELGANARAAIITRGLAEITRLGLALGARAETLAGLAGAGDLMLTCSSEQSRNFSFGKALGEGRRPHLLAGGPVVEGVVNARSVVRLAARLGVKMPLCEAVEAVLGGGSIDRAIDRLMTADLEAEPLSLQGKWRIPHPARTPQRLSA